MKRAGKRKRIIVRGGEGAPRRVVRGDQLVDFRSTNAGKPARFTNSDCKWNGRALRQPLDHCHSPMSLIIAGAIGD